VPLIVTTERLLGLFATLTMQDVNKYSSIASQQLADNNFTLEIIRAKVAANKANGAINV
jgi:hypothetical protein